MEDFTTGTIQNQPSRRLASLGPEWDARIQTLVKEWGAEKNPELIEELIVTALKIGRDEMGVADLKLINRSLKELRYAAKVFAPYEQTRKVAVFGSARTSPEAPVFKMAEEFGREIVKHNFMVITGGGDGIMGAAQKGAGRENSFGLNIRLPFEQRANPTIDGDGKLINFNYFFTRKLNFVKETHALALFPGGFGTMDEGFEVLTLMQTGKARIIPMVLLDMPDGRYWETWMKFVRDDMFKLGLISAEDFSLFKLCHKVSDAIAEIAKFYQNYHSVRWVGDQLVMRIHQRLTAEAMADLNKKFKDMVREGEIVQGKALPPEKNEPEIASLPRLILKPHRRDFGRFRQLIDAINCGAAGVKGKRNQARITRIFGVRRHVCAFKAVTCHRTPNASGTLAPLFRRNQFGWRSGREGRGSLCLRYWPALSLARSHEREIDGLFRAHHFVEIEMFARVLEGIGGAAAGQTWGRPENGGWPRPKRCCR